MTKEADNLARHSATSATFCQFTYFSIFEEKQIQFYIRTKDTDHLAPACRSD